MNLRIRPATPDDIHAILGVERVSYATPWTEGTFRSLLGREGVRFVVAEAGPAEAAEIVGHAVLWHTLDEGELANLAVAPDRRREGIGAALLEHVLDRVREAGVRAVFLEVRDSNEAAIELYRKRGFRRVGVRRQYYDRPKEDALILRLELRERGADPATAPAGSDRIPETGKVDP